jgi:hypothetical protein
MSFGTSEVSSWARLSASGIVGDSGKAIDVVGYSIKSGGTAGNIFFFSAATAVAANFAWADQARVVSAEQTIALAYPTRLSGGCYVSFDGNVSASTIFYRQVMGQ